MKLVYGALVLLSPLVFAGGAPGVGVYVAVLALLVARVELRTPRAADAYLEAGKQALEGARQAQLEAGPRA